VGGIEFHARRGIEIEYVEGFLHRFDDHFILLGDRRGQNFFDPARIKSGICKHRAGRQETQKGAAI
jgi:hypothetical protein